MRTKLLLVWLFVAAWPGLPFAGYAATNVVTISSYRFSPTNLTINVGDTIIWSNTVFMPHDTTQQTNLWSSGQLAQGQTFAFRFTNPGTFRYFCAVHIITHPEQTGTVSVVSAPNNPPTVLLTNPPNNASFRAPASLTLQASAGDPGGSVTNVQFFTNEVICGNSMAPPFNFSLTNVAAGNYALKARAVDNLGAAATSATVNVFVLTNAFITNIARIDQGQFRLSVLGIAGQTYTAEASSNLLNWAAFATNIAPANLFNITDATATNILQRFYRTRQAL